MMWLEILSFSKMNYVMLSTLSNAILMDVLIFRMKSDNGLALSSFNKISLNKKKSMILFPGS